MNYEGYYLILPADDGSRADTKIAVEYSPEQIEELLAQGYVLVDTEDFNRLIGNADKEYLINMDGTLYEKPPYVPSLDEVKTAKIEEIKAEYLNDLYQPVWTEQSDGNSYGYDSDKDSQVDFMASYQRAQIAGSTRYNVYVNKDDLSQKEFTIHTPAMFETALAAAGNYQEEVYAKYYMLKEKINGCKTKEEVGEITW